MTFEATETRAPETAVEDRTTAAARPVRRPARRESVADTMLGFATEGEVVATRLRGLAALFRGVFCDEDACKSDDAGPAADIIDDVLKSIAARLDANAEHARAARDHLTREGAR